MSRFQYRQEIIDALLNTNIDKIVDAALILEKATISKKIVFSCGNGGSFCNSLHFAEDFLSQPVKSNRLPIKTCALGANGGLTTCIANDYHYDAVFERELDVYGQEGDVLVAISGSGKSSNILKAAYMAKSLAMKVITFTGFDGGFLHKLGDVNINVPCHDMGMVESIHLILFHMLLTQYCSLI